MTWRATKKYVLAAQPTVGHLGADAVGGVDTSAQIQWGGVGIFGTVPVLGGDADGTMYNVGTSWYPEG